VMLDQQIYANVNTDHGAVRRCGLSNGVRPTAGDDNKGDRSIRREVSSL